MLFGSFGDDLFSASNDDGQNVILQNSDASLCDRALDICCHKKDGSLRLTPAPTPPPATASPLFPVRKYNRARQGDLALVLLKSDVKFQK